MSFVAPDMTDHFPSTLTRERPRPMAVGAVMDQLDRSLRGGDGLASRPMSTGFAVLDRAVSGGLKQGDLMLIGGSPGVGKTTLTLQMARNLASSGARVLYVCYEHDERFLLTKLMAMESWVLAGDEIEQGIRLRDMLARLEGAGNRDGSGLEAIVAGIPTLALASQRISSFADRLLLLRGSGTYTDLPALAAEIDDLHEADPQTPCVLFLDYLQKVPFYPDPVTETERVTRVVEGLKELALSRKVAIVAIVAADLSGLLTARLRPYHLRGGSAMLYEADIILILNEKHRIVTKQHLTYNQVTEQELHSWVVCTIEKNRLGRQSIDLEFRKHFEYSCFDPNGGHVAEMLIDERIQRD